MADLPAAHEIHADPATSAYNPAGPHTSLAQGRETLAEWPPATGMLT
ncbi:hypothetical protein [Planosporangium mesophilum]|uniref:Uncharacterized protein n=1 Tax=Planosporangium mesophilum TaxID=689768 RepID=A0A8J3T8E3_9ACTN|nr:hypothetical protein [Planosporangium mesophilum]NJC83014.1 hypothetical protein [Planosporangium mesophilum]GII22420.1 hypothetical protein Pme01_20170 [Planosporangium mesophilum]